MGYYASGNGTIKLKENINMTELKEKIYSIIQDSAIEMDDIDDKHISLWQCYNRFDEEVIDDVLNMLIPYIEDGVVNYLGDEDCLWRYKFYPDTQEWKEETATIDYNFESYSNEELIDELISRGYTKEELKDAINYRFGLKHSIYKIGF